MTPSGWAAKKRELYLLVSLPDSGSLVRRHFAEKEKNRQTLSELDKLSENDSPKITASPGNLVK